VAQYVAVYTMTPLDPMNAAQPEHVVIHRDELKRYLLGSSNVIPAPRCESHLHLLQPYRLYGSQHGWQVALGCQDCRGWGFRPRGRDKAAEVERVLLSKPMTGTPPAVDDWRERKGCIPAWLVHVRAECDRLRAEMQRRRPAVFTHGPQYRPRK
jgi:hypothetical protein